MDRRYWLAVAAVALLLLGSAAIAADWPEQPDDGADTTYLQVERVTDPVPENETVAYDSLSPEQQRLFEEAVADGGLVPVPEDADDSVWYDTRYVSYRNETYRVLVAVP